MQTPACSVSNVVAETTQIHVVYQVLWRKRDSTATLSRGEHLDPYLDRLLLLFWVHYIRTVLIYCVQVHFRWPPFTDNKGEGVANYYKEKGYLQMQRKKWLNWLHSILGRFSIDFRKLL